MRKHRLSLKERADMRYDAISEKYRGSPAERAQAERTLECLDDIDLADDNICSLKYELAKMIKQSEYIIATYNSGHGVQQSSIVYLESLTNEAKEKLS